MEERQSLQLKEFESLSKLLAKVPHKLQKGLFTQEYIEWTAVDADSFFIAIGTNVGIVYLVDRSNGQLQKLQCKTRTVAVTRVKLCHNVDYLVAVGTSTGQLFIFQLPSLLPGRKKQLHLYEVLDLHFSRISSLVWSQNSQKLYSGNVRGQVICTEFNYENETSKSYSVLTEPHEIVQLDYSSRTLLVSTTFRTLLHHTLERKQIQVGMKERRLQGAFGAVFVPGGVYYQPQDMVLFAVRPGLRIWKACSDGAVKTTFLFKDLVTKLKDGIDLLDDKLGLRTGTKVEDLQFGPLLMYMDTYLVTFHGGSLFVIDPGLGNFCGYHTGLASIKQVVVCEDEIFVLSSQQGKELIRIAQKPLPGSQTDKTIVGDEQTPSPLHTVSATAEKVSQSIVGAFNKMGGKFQDAIVEGQILPGPSKDPPWGSSKSMASSSLALEQPTSVVVVAKENSEPISQPSTSTGHSGLQRDLNITSKMTLFEDEENSDEADNNEQISSKAAEPVSSCTTEDGTSVSSDIAPGGPDWCNTTEVLHPGAPPLNTSSGDPLNRHKQFREERLAFASSESADSIAVPAKPKKKGKKKNKGQVDQDNISISSNDSQLSSKKNKETSQTPLSINSSPDTGSSNLTLQTPKVNGNFSDSPQIREGESNFNSQALDVNTPLVTYRNPTPDLEKLKKLESELTALPWEETPDEKYGGESSEVNGNSELNEEKVLNPSNDGVVNDGLYLCDSSEQNVSSHKELQSNVEESHNLAYKDPKPHTYFSTDANSSSSQWSSELNNLTVNQNEELVLNIETQPGVQDSPDLQLDLGLDHTAKQEDVFEGGMRQEKESIEESPGLCVETGPLDSSEEMFSIYDTRGSGFQSPLSSSSSMSQVMGESSIEDVLTYNSPSDKQAEKGPPQPSQKRVGFMDAWTEMLAPGNLQCLCVAERIIWVVDKSDRGHWSYLSGSSLKWHRLDVSAHQISVSPSGSIVWRLHNGRLFAGTKITTRAPAGLKWEDFVKKDVVSMCVDEHMGWYVKSNGEVVMQKKLTRERPCFKSLPVPCDHYIVMVVCRQNVVWCVTRDRNLLVRSGVSEDREEGTDWRFLDGTGLELLVSQFDLGLDGTAWVVDVVGRLWFTTGVTQQTPQGSGEWWQVPLTAYLMQDVVARQAMKAIAEKPGELTRMRKKEDLGGLVSTRCGGIWLCPGFKNVLHLCCSNLEGHRWDTVYLPNMESSTFKWYHIGAGGLTGGKGLVWLQQPNGYIFCFHTKTKANSNSVSKVTEVAPPEPGISQPFVCLSVCEGVVWTLTSKGKVWLRTDIRPSCPHGVAWKSLDMQQLAGARLLWLSAGTQNVWAVDSRGCVYLRIGTEPPSAHGLNQAWVPVDGTTDSSDAKFVRIHVGHNDWMVWALDSQDRVYTRKGVTDSMPIGTHWVSVAGEHLKQLCVGEHYVYGLNSTGEVLVRDGIKESHPKGTYWHKIPGCLSSLSASRDGDLLWGVDLEGQIVCRFSEQLQLREEVLPNLVRVTERAEDVEGDWELL